MQPDAWWHTENHDVLDLYTQKYAKKNICAKSSLILRKKYGHFVETLLLIGVFHDTIPFFSYFIKEASGLLVSNSSQKNPVLTKEKNFSWFEFYFCKVFIFYLIFMKNKFWLWKYSKFQPKKKPGSYIKFLPIIFLETERKFPFCTQGN